MKGSAALTALALAIVVSLAGCGFLSTGIPGWCGGVTSGPKPLSSESAMPAATADPHHLLCISAVNLSNVDMGLQEPETWGLIQACQGMSASEPDTLGSSWSVEVGRAGDASIAGPILARFEESQFTGNPPYLLEVVINADLTATIRQRSSLPFDAASRHC